MFLLHELLGKLGGLCSCAQGESSQSQRRSLSPSEQSGECLQETDSQVGTEAFRKFMGSEYNEKLHPDKLLFNSIFS